MATRDIAETRRLYDEWVELGNYSDVFFRYFAFQTSDEPSVESAKDELPGTKDTPSSPPDFVDNPKHILTKRLSILRHIFSKYAIDVGLRKPAPDPAAEQPRRPPRRESNQRRRQLRDYDIELSRHAEEYFMISSLLPISSRARGGEDSHKLHTFRHNNVCTFTETGRNFEIQRWYNCRTCGLTGNTGCCEICVQRCHLGHEVSYRKTGKFYCDCGSGHNGCKCKALLPPNSAPKAPAKTPSKLLEFYYKLAGGKPNPEVSRVKSVPSAAGLTIKDLRAMTAKLAEIRSTGQRLDDATTEPVEQIFQIITSIAARLHAVQTRLQPQPVLSETDIEDAKETSYVLVLLATTLGLPEGILRSIEALLSLQIACPGLKFPNWFGRDGKTGDTDAKMATIPPVVSALEDLAGYHKGLDNSAICKSGLRFSWNQSFVGKGPSRVPHALAVAKGGGYLFLHGSEGLQKIGTGVGGTTRGHIYTSRPDFFPSDPVSICCIGDRLYVKSTSMPRSYIAVLSCLDLQNLRPIRVRDGVAVHKEKAQTKAKKPLQNPTDSQCIVSDGRYLYLVCAASAPIDASKREKGGGVDVVGLGEGASAFDILMKSAQNAGPKGRFSSSSTDKARKKKKTKLVLKVEVYDPYPDLGLDAKGPFRGDDDRQKEVHLKREGKKLEKKNKETKAMAFIGDLKQATKAHSITNIVIDCEFNPSTTLDGLSKALKTGSIYCTGRDLVVLLPPYIQGVSCPIPGKYSIRTYDLQDGKLKTHDISTLNPQYLRAAYESDKNVIWTSMARPKGNKNWSMERSRGHRLSCYSNLGPITTHAMSTIPSRPLRSPGDALGVLGSRFGLGSPLELGMFLMAQLQRITTHAMSLNSQVEMREHVAKSAVDEYLRLRRELHEAETRHQKRLEQQKESKDTRSVEEMDDIDVLLRIGANIEAKCGVSPTRTGQLGHQPWRKSYRGRIVGTRFSNGDTTYDVKFDDGERVPDVKKSEVIAIISRSGEVLQIPGGVGNLDSTQRDLLAMLQAMGFSESASLHAMRQSRWDIERAVDYITVQVDAVAMVEQQYLIAQHSIHEEAQKVRREGINSRQPVIDAEKRLKKSAEKLEKVLENLGIKFDSKILEAEDKDNKVQDLVFAIGSKRSLYILNQSPRIYNEIASLLAVALPSLKDPDKNFLYMDYIAATALRVLAFHLSNLPKDTRTEPFLKSHKDLLLQILAEIPEISESPRGSPGPDGQACENHHSNLQQLSASCREVVVPCVLSGLGVLFPGVKSRLGLLMRCVGEAQGGNGSRIHGRLACHVMHALARIHQQSSKKSQGRSETAVGSILSENLQEFSTRVQTVISFLNRMGRKIDAEEARDGPLSFLAALLQDLILRSDLLSVCDKKTEDAKALAELSNKLLEVSVKVLEASTRTLKGIAEEIKGKSRGSLSRCLEDASRSSCLYLLPSVATIIFSTKMCSTERIMGVLQEALATCDRLNLTEEWGVTPESLEREVVIETGHPYGCGKNLMTKHIYMPGATGMVLHFDKRSCTEGPHDVVKLYDNPDRRIQLPFGPYCGNSLDQNSSFPKRNVVIQGDSVTLTFDVLTKPEVMKDAQQQLESDTKARWGFRCTARGFRVPKSSAALNLLQILSEASAGVIHRLLNFKSLSLPHIPNPIYVPNPNPNSSGEGELKGKASAEMDQGTKSLDEKLVHFHAAAKLPLLTRGLREINSDKTIMSPQTSRQSQILNDADSFLENFVNGHNEASSMMKLIKANTPNSDPAIQMYVSRLRKPYDEEWDKTFRAVVGAMIHHSGLVIDVYLAASPQKRMDLRSLPLLDKEVLNERLSAILQCAVYVQRAMIRHVQALKMWRLLATEPDGQLDRKAFVETHGDDQSGLKILCIYAKTTYLPQDLNKTADLLYTKLASEWKQGTKGFWAKSKADDTIGVVCQRFMSICQCMRRFKPYYCSLSSMSTKAEGQYKTTDYSDDEDESGSNELENLELSRNFSVPIKRQNRKRRIARRQANAAAAAVDNTKQPGEEGSEDDLQDISLGRTLSERYSSSTTSMKSTPRSVRGRLGEFRNWIDTYRQWKAWSTLSASTDVKNTTTTSTATPFLAVHNVLVGGTGFTAQEILTVARCHNSLADMRQKGLEKLTNLLKICHHPLPRLALLQVPHQAFRGVTAIPGGSPSPRTRESAKTSGRSPEILGRIDLCEDGKKAMVLQGMKSFLAEASRILIPPISASFGTHGSRTGTQGEMTEAQEVALRAILEVPVEPLGDKLIFGDIQRVAFDHALLSITHVLKLPTKPTKPTRDPTSNPNPNVNTKSPPEGGEGGGDTKIQPSSDSTIRPLKDVVAKRLESVLSFARMVVSAKRSLTTSSVEWPSGSAQKDIISLRTHVLRGLVDLFGEAIKPVMLATSSLPSKSWETVANERAERCLDLLLEFFANFADRTAPQRGRPVSRRGRANISKVSAVDIAALTLALIVLNSSSSAPSFPRRMRLASRLARVFWPMCTPQEVLMKYNNRFEKIQLQSDIPQFLLQRIGVLDLPTPSASAPGPYFVPKVDVKADKEKAEFYVVVHRPKATKRRLDEEQWYHIFSELPESNGYSYTLNARNNLPDKASSESKRANKEEEALRARRHQKRVRWKGHSSTSIFTFNGSCSARSLEVSAKSNLQGRRASFRLETRVTNGKWYFEVEVVSTTCSMLRVGWCTQRFSPRNNQPAGADRNSWVFDVLEGFRVHADRKETYSTPNIRGDKKLRKGTIVGCRFDVAKGRMSFYLNSRPLGVAFDGISATTGFQPCVSMSQGSRVRLHLLIRKFKSKPDAWGGYYYPLSGDSPRLVLQQPTTPTYQSRAIVSALEQKSYVVLAKGTRLACETLAKSISQLASSIEIDAEPVLPTVCSEDSVNILSTPIDPYYPGKLGNKQVIWPEVHRGLASELIALCRFLLTKTLRTKWAIGLRRLLEAVITSIPYKKSSCSSEEFAMLVGSLAVAGGFLEVLRIGGHVSIPRASDVNGGGHINGMLMGFSHLRGGITAEVNIDSEVESFELALLDARSEVTLSLNDFHLSAHAFAALHSLIRIEKPESKWEHRELQWRAVLMLESLISQTQKSAGPNAPLPVEPAVYNSMAALLVELAKSSLPHERLSRSTAAYFDTRNALWWTSREFESSDLTGVLACPPAQTHASPSTFCINPTVPGPAPLKTAAKEFKRPVVSAGGRQEWVFGASELVTYLQRGGSDASALSDEELRRSRLVEHWNRHIIPSVMKIVGLNLKDYQVLDFLEQVRIRLREGEPMRAVGVVLAVCGNHCPEGVVFPSPGRDWLLLTEADIQVGDIVSIGSSTKKVTTSHFSHEAMACVGRKARVLRIADLKNAKAEHSRAEEPVALLQVYNLDTASVTHVWAPISVLHKSQSPSKSLIPTRLYLSAKSIDLLTNLGEHSGQVARLVARRALFGFASSRASFQRIQILETPVLGFEETNKKIHILELAIGEALNFSSLQTLGAPVPSHAAEFASAEANLDQLLNAVHRASSGSAWQLISESFKRHLAKSLSLPNSLKLAASRCVTTCVKAVDAAFLIMLFAAHSSIPEGCKIEFRAEDPTGSVMRTIEGGKGDSKSGKTLAPVVMSGSECYITVVQPKPDAVRASLRVIPVQTSLAIAFWLVKFYQSRASSGARWAEARGEGGYFEMVKVILDTFVLEKMEPSPAKQAIVSLISSLLAAVEVSVGSPSSTGGASPSELPAEVKTARSDAEVRSGVLSRLEALQGEMERMYDLERSKGFWISSYAQTLIHTMTGADALRSPSNQIVKKAKIDPLKMPKGLQDMKLGHDSKDEKKSGTVWQCAHCTVENPIGATSCTLCLQPKKVLETKMSSPDGDPELYMDASEMFHDMRVLMEAIKALPMHQSNSTPRVAALRKPGSLYRSLVEACWKETKVSDIEDRLVLIRNVPHVVTDPDESDKDVEDLVKEIVQEAAPFAVIHGCAIGVATYSKWPAVELNSKLFSSTRNSNVWRTSEADEHKDTGIFRRILSSNPNSLKISLSSLSRSSQSPESLLLKSLIPVSTESKPNSWIIVSLETGEHAIPTAYSMIVSRSGVPRSWRLEGSCDGKSWNLLRDHKTGRKGNGGFQAYEAGVDEKTGEKITLDKLSRGIWRLGDEKQKWLGYTKFRIMATGTDCNGRWGLNGLRAIEIFGILGGKELQNVPKPVPTNQFAVVQVMNSSKEKIEKMVSALNNRTIDSLRLHAKDDSLCVPRVVELRAWKLSELDPHLSTQALNALHRKQIFKAEDEVTERFSSVMDEIILSYLPTFSEPKIIISEAKPGVAEPKPLSEANLIIPEATLSKILTVLDPMEDTSQVSLKSLKAHVSSHSPSTLIDWIIHNNYDINLCKSSFNTLTQALAALQALTPTQASGIMDYLMDLSREIGVQSLFSLRSSQLVDTGLEACKLLDRISIGDVKATANVKMGRIRLLFGVLKRVNAWFIELYPLLSQESAVAELIRRMKSLVFPYVKSTLIAKILDFTSQGTAPQLTVTVDRMSAALARDRATNNNVPLDFRRDTIFGSAFKQLKSAPAKRFCVRRPSGASPHLGFRIVTKNEHVVGEGGPYRQFFTDISKELLSGGKGGLFIPSPNQRGNVGSHRDKYIINPNTTATGGAEMLYFLGQLFGVCIRTGVKMMLYCPPLVWKLLAGDAVGRSDLRNVDYTTTEVLSLFEDLDEKTFSQTFSDEVQSYTIRLSDGSTRVLKPNGASIPVTYANRLEYVNLAFKARLQEQAAELILVRRGLESVIPPQGLSLMTWGDLERGICGRAEIDIAMLRRHTRYSGVDGNAAHIKIFWNLLGEFSQENLRNLIRFCWGQDRLPATDKDFEDTHTRLLIKSSNYRNPDRALPRADTCFFNLELPAYSSKAIMKERLVYAISTAITMNADQQQNDGGGF